MILVDTSVWVDHLRSGVGALVELLDEGMVLTHPFVIGELALGDLHQRPVVMDALSGLPRVSVATDEEVLRFIDSQALFGRGVGHVDVHLLAAARLTAGTGLWTKNRRLDAIAAELGMAYDSSRLRR